MGKILGIYFGTGKISAVELAGRHILKQASLDIPPMADKSGEDLLASALKGFIRDNKFTAKEVVAGLSSKDLFIRGFQMPPLAKSEIDSGISFEARKYLPFKTEDLVFDYQYRMNKAAQKLDVLYIASARNNFERYLELFKQIGLRIRAIESGGFALLRVISAAKQFNSRQSIAIVAIEDDLEMEFSIVSQGFPCFSRDVKLSRSQDESVAPGLIEGVSQERLTSEIRVSLDYFRRQFSGGSVDRIIFAAKAINPGALSELSKSLGLEMQALDLQKDKELSALTDLTALKACGVGLKDALKVNLSCDLLRQRKEHRQALARQVSAPAKPLSFSPDMLTRPLFFAALILAAAYVFPLYEQFNTAKGLKQIKLEAENVLVQDLIGLDRDALRLKKAGYQKKLMYIKELAGSRKYLTGSFNALPQIVSRGLWIEQLDIASQAKDRSVRLKGAVYMGDKGAEEKAAADFLKSLRSSPDFMQGLSRLEMTSTQRTSKGEYKILVFEISGS